ncbi:MAG: hypothetical protein WD898_00010 [Candidatus Paceibacterota bacterium]
MRKITKTVSIHVLDFTELASIEKELIGRACEARLRAQAPYSNYWVGCALVTKNGIVMEGCNVENVNWSETVHAEENAISSTVAKLGPFSISAMAVVGAPANAEVVWPPNGERKLSPIQNVGDVCPSCGHCLQCIAENCFGADGKYDPSVVMLGYSQRTGEIYRTTIGDAFPMPFLPQHLGVNYALDARNKS